MSEGVCGVCERERERVCMCVCVDDESGNVFVGM